MALKYSDIKELTTMHCTFLGFSNKGIYKDYCMGFSLSPDLSACDTIGERATGEMCEGDCNI